MKKRQIIGLAVDAVLCAGFASCGGDDDDEPQNPIENTGSGSNGSGNSGNGGGNGSDPANPETDEYGIAVSQEVDLGLSVNWAGWNVGATKPEECGGYYAWGETEEKTEYSWSTYKWCNGTYNSLTKYCTNSDYGTVDNKKVLESGDDVAHVKWGDGWRMPTRNEIGELVNNCTWKWMEYYNATVNGYKVTGPNGNSIFIPAAGYRNGTSLGSAGSYGGYWSGALYSGYSGRAFELYFYSDNHHVYDSNRFSGQSVRPVREK